MGEYPVWGVQGDAGPRGIQPTQGGFTRAGWCRASPQDGASAAPLCIPIPWGLQWWMLEDRLDATLG